MNVVNVVNSQLSKSINTDSVAISTILGQLDL